MKAAAQTIRTGSMDGLVSGLIGVIIFSGSLPATRLAVLGLPPLFVTSARAAMAAVLAAVLLLILRQKRPQRSDLLSLAVIALGVVIGFPLLTAMALRSFPRPIPLSSLAFCRSPPPFLRRTSRGERPKASVLAVLRARQSACCGLCPVEWRAGFSARRSSDDRRRHCLWPWLCGRRQAGPQPGRLAGHLLGAGAIHAAHGLLCLFTWPQELAAVPVTAWAGSPMSPCSACWLALSSGITGWRRAAQPPSVNCNFCNPLRASSGGTAAGRGGVLVHACSNHRCDFVCCSSTLFRPAAKASKKMSSIKGIKAGAQSGRSFLFYVI